MGLSRGRVSWVGWVGLGQVGWVGLVGLGWVRLVGSGIRVERLKG